MDLFLAPARIFAIIIKYLLPRCANYANNPEMAKSNKVKCHFCKGTGEEFNHAVVGAQMKARREKASIKAVQVANHMKVSKSYLSNLEKGLRAWRTQLIARYSSALK